MIRVYRALATQQVQVMLQYRVATFLYALFSFVRPIIFLAAWLAVAGSQGGVLGTFQRGDLAAYYAISILVTHLTTSFATSSSNGRSGRAACRRSCSVPCIRSITRS